VYDILGREITTLVNNKEQLAENYDIYLNVLYGSSTNNLYQIKKNVIT